MREFLKRCIFFILSPTLAVLLMWTTTIVHIFSFLKLSCCKDNLHWKCEALASVMGIAGVFLPSYTEGKYTSLYKTQKGYAVLLVEWLHHSWAGCRRSCSLCHSHSLWGHWHLPELCNTALALWPYASFNLIEPPTIPWKIKVIWKIKQENIIE